MLGSGFQVPGSGVPRIKRVLFRAELNAHFMDGALVGPGSLRSRNRGLATTEPRRLVVAAAAASGLRPFRAWYSMFDVDCSVFDVFAFEKAPELRVCSSLLNAIRIS